MANTLPLIGKIKGYFPNHRICVVKVLLLLVSTILHSRTTNLNKCKSKVGISQDTKTVNPSNAYVRFIRFFKIKNVDGFCLGIAHVILGLFSFVGPCYLIIDRTNWEIGGEHINVLCLGLLLPTGSFVPVIWESLDKKGNSCTKEREALLQRFREAWPGAYKRDLVLLGDREFIGLNWFIWLKNACMGFVIRLRWQDYFHEIASSNGLTVHQFEQKMRFNVEKNGFFHLKFTLKDHVLYFTALRNTAKRRTAERANPGDDFVLLISTMPGAGNAGGHYKKRWGIEVFFKHIKTNGFNFEDMNLKKRDKIQLMTGVLAIAYAISISEGVKLEELAPAKLKKHGYRAVSLFRKGYDSIQIFVQTTAELLLFIVQGLKKTRPLRKCV